MKLSRTIFGIIILIFSVLFFAGTMDVTAQTRQRKKVVKKTAVQPKNTNNSNSPKTSKEAKILQDAVQKEIQLTQKRIQENDLRVNQELLALSKIDLEIEATTKIINQLNSQVSKLNGEITG